MAYEEDKSIMRFRTYNPIRISGQFQKFAAEVIPYNARDEFAWQEHKVFITQDEIDAFLAGGGPYSDGRLSTYSFYLLNGDDKARTDFIKEKYGIGGQSHALCGADNSHADYDGKGLKLERGDYGNPDTSVLLPWAKVAKRIGYLIDNQQFLRSADYSRMPEYERERIAGKVISFYARLPEEIERPFKQDFFNEEARKELPVMLNDSEKSQKLLQAMDDALAMLPLDFESVNETYEKKLQLLTEVHQYVEGSYTIFPAQEVPDQADVLNGYQMSLFDIVSASEPEESEVEESSAEMEEVQKGESESEPEDVVVQEQWDENVFEYQGYHFEAVGVLPQGLEGKELVNQTRGNTELHLTAYEREDDILYSYAGFYEASGSSKADIFRCMETGRNYIPGENELFGYEGEFLPYLQNEQVQEQEPHNFHITDDDLGAGGPKAKFKANMELSGY